MDVISYNGYFGRMDVIAFTAAIMEGKRSIDRWVVMSVWTFVVWGWVITGW